MPQVSVVMPVYNGERFLGEAIESVLAQTFGDFEFIIVDDGSTDGSAEIIREYAERDERIRSIPLPENRGAYPARNVGIGQANGRYIAAMDSDDISLPERLARQVAFLDARPDIDGVGTGVQAADADMNPTFVYRLPTIHPFILLSMMVGGSAMMYATSMVRRELLESSGGFIEDSRASADFELFFRLVRESGARYANLPESLYVYRRHADSLTNTQTTWPPPVHEAARQRALESLWGLAPEGTLARFIRVRPGVKLGWRDRRLARRDMIRLIQAMSAANWVDPGDEGLLLPEMERRLEGTMPRLWQMCLHWWRYRILRRR